MRNPRILQRASHVVLAAAFIVAVAAVSDGAQNVPRRASGPMYDTATEATLTGTITAVRELSGPSECVGTHLTLKAVGKFIDVHVAPSWYLEREKIEFAEGNRVAVTGSKITYQGQPILIAREVKMGIRTITLRNARGFPKWMRSRGGMGKGAKNR